jgi:hypothetical protein
LRVFKFPKSGTAPDNVGDRIGYACTVIDD